MEPRVGDWVEVRAREEILKTLDERGQLDGLPFMPQMFEYSGQRFRVFKRAHKTCDTVNDYKGRRMEGAVHLDGIRCDGQAYGGCQAACLIFWKVAWLKSVPGPAAPAPNRPATRDAEKNVWAGTKAVGSDDTDPTYVCQATQVPAATKPLPWWKPLQYVEDLTSGNIDLFGMLRGFLYMGFRGLENGGIGLGRPLRWIYDTLQHVWGGVPYPRRRGKIPAGVRTPDGFLNLQPGDWVRVKSYKEILATLDTNNKNRGLFFDAEMVPYCGCRFRVLRRVTRIVNERTGRMTEFKNPCIMLEGVVCESRYSECRLFCPRAIYSYWREIWLEKIQNDEENPTGKEVEEAPK